MPKINPYTNAHIKPIIMPSQPKLKPINSDAVTPNTGMPHPNNKPKIETTSNKMAQVIALAHPNAITLKQVDELACPI